MCYHVEFGRSALKDVVINTGEPPKLGIALIRMGGVADPKIHAPPTCVTTSKGVCINRNEPPKLGSAGIPHGAGRARPPKTSQLPIICYHVKFGSSATKGVCINERSPQNWRALGLRPLWMGRSWSLKTSPRPICVTTSNLVVMRRRTCA